MGVEKRLIPAANGKTQTRWLARYRTPEGNQKSASFARKVDAERYLTGIEGTKLTGSYIDPELGRLTVGKWAERWLESQAHLAPSTRERYAGILREHIVPRWEHVKLAEVSHADVQSWLTELGKGSAPASVRKVHRVLSLMLALGVKDGRLVRNVASGVSLPRVVAGEHRYLTHPQVAELAEACGPDYRLMVNFLAYTGVRFGEMAALRVERLDFLRRRAMIAESVTPVKGVLTWGPTKGHERREVPLPRFLVDELSAHVAGKARDALVFTGGRGAVMRAQTFQRAAMTEAATKIGTPGLHPHELRHTAASLAIASRADVKVVQQMLGHKSATMTLDLYGHLFGDRLDEVGDALDSARTEAGVYWMCTEAKILDFPERA